MKKEITRYIEDRLEELYDSQVESRSQEHQAANEDNISDLVRILEMMEDM